MRWIFAALFVAHIGIADTFKQVECTSKEDKLERVFKFSQVDKVWAISFKSKETGKDWVVLEYRRKNAPTLSYKKLAMDYTSPVTGGIAVKWKVENGKGTFSANVNYELEVNDPGYRIPLDPQVEHLHTDEPITDLDCIFS